MAPFPIAAPIKAPVEAGRLGTVIDGNDGKVDEEDDRKSDKQHRKAFYRAVTITIMM